MGKEKFEFKTDAKGKFSLSKKYDPEHWYDKIGCKEAKVKLKGKLIAPKGASVEGTMTVNKTKKPFKVTAGKAVAIGPFDMTNCVNSVEIVGTSDKPNEKHVVEVEPG